MSFVFFFHVLVAENIPPRVQGCFCLIMLPRVDMLRITHVSVC